MGDYESICKSTKGIAKNAASTGVIFDPVASSLFYGGNTENINVSWSPGQAYACRATYTVSGIYRGNSTRRNIDVGVTGFIVNNNNQLLAHNVDPMQ